MRNLILLFPIILFGILFNSCSYSTKSKEYSSQSIDGEADFFETTPIETTTSIHKKYIEKKITHKTGDTILGLFETAKNNLFDTENNNKLKVTNNNKFDAIIQLSRETYTPKKIPEKKLKVVKKKPYKNTEITYSEQLTSYYVKSGDSLVINNIPSGTHSLTGTLGEDVIANYFIDKPNTLAFEDFSKSKIFINHYYVFKFTKNSYFPAVITKKNDTRINNTNTKKINLSDWDSVTYNTGDTPSCAQFPEIYDNTKNNSLTIKNNIQNKADIFLFLNRIKDSLHPYKGSKKHRGVYIKYNESFTLKNISSGEFKLSIVSGFNWKQSFRNNHCAIRPTKDTKWFARRAYVFKNETSHHLNLSDLE